MIDIPVTILQRFDEIYRLLSTEENRILLPERDAVMSSVNRCSFRMFDEPEEFLEAERAKSHPQLVSPNFDSAFRVYFNSYSRKVYVDLNRDPMTAIHITAETETQLLCDLIRSVLLADPTV